MSADLPALAQRPHRLGEIREQVAAAHVHDDRDPRQHARRASSVRSSSGLSICGGRLSTTYQPRSSSAFAAVDRPAPDIPVTISTSPVSRSASAMTTPVVALSLSTREQVRVDRRGELGPDARQLGDLAGRRLLECRHRAEMAQQRLDARVAEPRHLGEHALDVAPAALALMGDGEAVGLVAQSLQQVQRLARCAAG